MADIPERFQNIHREALTARELPQTALDCGVGDAYALIRPLAGA